MFCAGMRGWLARLRLRRMRMAQEEGRTKAILVIQRGVRAWHARNVRKELEEQRAQYAAQTAKFMKQVGD